MQLLIRDETASGSVTHELTLDVLDETITVRQLIRSRVYQEVQDHNRRLDRKIADFRGLLKPASDKPADKSGSREIDWKQQFEKACDAFERNGFFILVNDRQAEALDEMLTLHHDSRISFVKLMPLVGG